MTEHDQHHEQPQRKSASNPAVQKSEGTGELSGEAVVQPVPAIPVAALANLRRSLVVSICLGVASLLVLALLGHPLMGLFACVGLALGAMNSRMVQRSVLNFASSEAPNKKSRFTRSVLGRLGLVTLIAIGCAMLVRPDGLGVFCGLAVFQLLMLGGASIPVFRSLRPRS